MDMDIDIWVELRRFLPHLRKFRDAPQLGLINAGIPSMAENIMVLIETRGVGVKSKIEKESRYVKALSHVASPMLPIKGHGLLELRRLVEEKDEETLRNEETLSLIFQREMKNDDSYVYLMAIQGLACLGLKFHSIVVPILIDEYGGFERSNSRRVMMTSGGGAD